MAIHLIIVETKKYKKHHPDGGVIWKVRGSTKSLDEISTNTSPGKSELKWETLPNYFGICLHLWHLYNRSKCEFHFSIIDNVVVEQDLCLNLLCKTHWFTPDSAGSCSYCLLMCNTDDILSLLIVCSFYEDVWEASGIFFTALSELADMKGQMDAIMDAKMWVDQREGNWHHCNLRKWISSLLLFFVQYCLVWVLYYVSKYLTTELHLVTRGRKAEMKNV